MRFKNLKLKVTFFLALALMVAVFLFSLLVIRNQREEILQQAVDHSSQLSKVVAGKGTPYRFRI